MVNLIAEILMIVGGFLIAVSTLIAASWAIGWYAAKLFHNLTKVYSYTVLQYWLNRLEKEGRVSFKNLPVDHQ